MYNVVVNNDTCTGCEECINVCPNECFQLTDDKSDPYQGAECVFCESCLGVCPTDAIVITEL